MTGGAWAPAGKEQRDQRADSAEPNWRDFVKNSSPAWFTGGQTGSSNNALVDDTFLARMYKQQQDAEETGVNPYGRSDFTGVALYNGSEGSNHFNYGDTWFEGKKTGNIFQDYDVQDANALMAQFMLDPQEQRRLYRNYGEDQDGMAAELKKVSEGLETDVKNYKSGKEFESAVQNKVANMGKGEDAAIVGGATLASAGTGALIGTAIAPGVGTLAGTVIGGLVGLGGSLLNLDQLRDNWARADAQVEAAEASGEDMRLGRQIGAYSQAFSSNTATFGNLFEGVAAQLAGERDPWDDQTAMEMAAEEGSEAKANFLHGAQLVGTTADLATLFTGNLSSLARVPGAAGAAARFANSARAVEEGSAFLRGYNTAAKAVAYPTTYQLGIAGQIVGDTSDLIEGRTWNPQTGQYQQMSDTQRLAMFGAMGLNAVQMKLPAGLAKGMTAGAKVANEATGIGKLTDNVLSSVLKSAPGSRLAKNVAAKRAATSRVEHGAVTYYLDDAGNAIAARANAGVFAPAEFLKSFSAGAMALRRKVIKQGVGITANDVYQASTLLSNNRKLATMFVTASTEASEEAIETFYRGYAVGDPSWNDIAWAAAGGALGGVTMSAPYALLERRQSENLWDSISELSTKTGIDLPMDRKTFLAASDKERMAVFQQVRKMGGTLTSDAAVDAMENMNLAGAAGSNQVARAARARLVLQDAKARENSVPGVSLSSKVTLDPSPFSEGYHWVTGPAKLINDYKNWLRVVEAAETKAIGAPGPMTTALQQIVQQLEADWEGFKKASEGILTNSDEDRALRAGIINDYVRKTNTILQDAWDGKMGVDAARAVGMLQRRYPTDNVNSFVLGLGQVSVDTVGEEYDGREVGVYLMPAAMIQGLTMDFDGDFSVMVDTVLDQNAWVDRRSGASYNAGVSEEGVGGKQVGGFDILQTPYHTTALDQATLIKLSGNGKEKYQYGRIVKQFADRVREVVTTKEGDMLVSEEFLNQYLFKPLKSGRPSKKLFEEFWLALGRSPQGRALTDYGRQTLENLPFKINKEFTFLAQHVIMTGFARQTRQLAPIIQESDEAQPPVRQDRARENSRLAPASLPVSNVTLQTRQEEDFRRNGHVNYNNLTPETLQALFVEGDPQAGLYYQNIFVNTAEVKGATEAAMSRNQVERTALNILYQIQDRLNVGLKSTDARWGLLELANYHPSENSSETFLQIALKQAVDIVQRTYPDFESDLVQQKFVQYRNLDKIQAARVVLDSVPVDELLYYKSGTQVGLTGTLGDNASLYAVSGEGTRATTKQRLQIHNDWNTGTWKDDPQDIAKAADSGPTRIRILGQIIMAEGKNLSLDHKTGLAYTNYGVGKDDKEIDDALAEIQPRLRAYLRAAMQAMPRALTIRKLDASKGLTAENVYALLDTDDQLAARLIEIVPTEVTNQLWDADTGRFTKGFMQFLTAEDPQTGVDALWREGVMAAINKIDADSKSQKHPEDRLVQALAALRDHGTTAAEYESLVNAVLTKPRKEAVATINKMFTNFAPNLVWLRSEAYLAPGGQTGGYSVTVSPKDQKEALTELADTLDKLDKSLRERAKFEEDSFLVGEMLREETNSGGGPATRAVQARLDFLKKLGSLRGPTMRVNAIVYSGLVRSGTADKGTSDLGFEALAAYAAAADPRVFGVGDVQIAGDQAAYSEYDLYLHPEILLHEARIMTGSGAYIKWPGLTPELVGRMYNDPIFKPLIDAVIDPAIYDTDTVVGVGVQRYNFSVSPDGKARGLGGILTRDGHGGTTIHLPQLGDTRQGKILAAAMADAQTPTGEWQRYAIMYYHALMAQRSDGTATDQEMHDTAVEALELAGEIVQDIADLSDGELKKYKKHLEYSLQGSYDNPALKQEVEVARKQLIANKAELSKGLKKMGVDEKAIDALARELEASIEGKSLGKALYDSYTPKLEVKDPRTGKVSKFFDPEQKMRLQQKLVDYGSLLATNVNKNSNEILALQREVRNRDVLTEFPSEDSWTRIASALFNHEVAQYLSLGSIGSSMGLIDTKEIVQGEYGDLADDTQSFFVQRILDDRNGLLSSTRAISDPQSRGTKSGRDIARKHLNLIYGQDRKKIEHHTHLSVSRTIQALNADTTSAATTGIATGGVLPEMMWKPSQATEYRWSVKPTVPPREVLLTQDELESRVYNQSTDRMDPDPEGWYRVRTDAEGRSWMLGDLVGRTYTQVMVNYTNKNGEKVSVPLSELFRDTTMFPLAAAFNPEDEAQAALFHTSPELIRDALRVATARGGKLIGAKDITIAASYYHPNDAPAGETNAYVYQGAYNWAEPSIILSPLAGIIDVNGLVRKTSRTSLDALKKNMPALYNAVLQTDAGEAVRAVTDAEGKVNYGGLLSLLVSNHMKTAQGYAGDSFPPQYIHVAENLYKLMTMVRVNFDGNVHVFSLAEVMAAGGDFTAIPGAPAGLAAAAAVTSDVIFFPTDHQNIYFDRVKLQAGQPLWNGTWDNDLLRTIYPGMFEPNQDTEDPLDALAKSSFVARRAGTFVSLRPLTSYKDKRQSVVAFKARTDARGAALEVRNKYSNIDPSNPGLFERYEADSKKVLDDVLGALHSTEQARASVLDSIRATLSKDIVVPYRKYSVPIAREQKQPDNYRNRPKGLVWRITNKGTGKSLTETSFDGLFNSKKEIPPAPLDVAVWDVGVEFAHIEDSETQLNTALAEIRRALDAGFELILEDSTGGSLDAALRQELFRKGYIVADTISQPNNDESMTADERAISTRLQATNLLDVNNRILAFGVEGFPLFEQAGVIQKSETADALSTYVGSQLLSLSGIPGARMANPLGDDIGGKQARVVYDGIQKELSAIDAATATKSKAVTPIIDHLVTQSFQGKDPKPGEREKVEKALLVSLRKTRQYNPDTLRPREDLAPGSEYFLEEGDVFFLNLGDDVILWRAGYDPIPGSGVSSTHLINQLKTEIKSGDVRFGLAINSYKPQQGISFREAFLSRMDLIGETTWDVKQRIPLSELYTKILMNVFKTTSQVEPSTLPYQLPENLTRFTTFWGNNADIDGKQTSVLRIGTLNDSSALFGHSFVESVVKAFKLYTDEQWAEIQASYDSGDNSEYTSALAKAREAVNDRVRRLIGKGGLYGSEPRQIQRELAKMAAENQSLGKVFSDLLGVTGLGTTADAIAHQQIAAAIILNATIPGTDVEHLLSSNGLANSDTTVEGLHILGAFFDDRPGTDAVKQVLLRQQEKRLHTFLPNARLSADGHRVLIDVVSNKPVKKGEKPETITLTLTMQLPLAQVSSDDAPVLQRQAAERKHKQGLSRNQEASLYLQASGAVPSTDPNADKAAKRILPPATAKQLFGRLADAEVAPMPVPLSAKAQLILDMEERILQESKQAVSFEEWEDEGRQYEKDRLEFANEYMNGNLELVDHMVRLLYWRRKKEGAKFGDVEYGWVSPTEAAGALAYFKSQMKNNRFPMFGAPTGAMDAAAVYLIAEQAWALRQEGKNYFIPSNDLTVERADNSKGTPRKSKAVKVKMTEKPADNATWREFLGYYMDVALAELYVTKRESYDEITASAMLQTFQPYYANELHGARLQTTLPAEMGVFDPELERFIVSLDRDKLDAIADDPLISDDFQEAFFQNLALDYTISPEYSHSIPEKVLKGIKSRRKAWDHGIRVLQRDIDGSDMTRGKVVKRSRDHHRAETLSNTVVQMSILARTANPTLMLPSILEQGARLGTANIANVMTGPTANRFGEIGILLNDTIDSFTDNKGVQSVLNSVFNSSPYVREGGSVKLNRAIQKTLRWQSWTRSNRSASKTFVEAVARSLVAAPGAFGGLTLESAMRILKADPGQFKATYGDLWEMGERAVAESFGTRQVGATYIMNKGLSALSNGNPAVAAVSDLALRGPLAFAGYLGNVFINMTGLQGVSALMDTGAAVIMGRSKKKGVQEFGQEMLKQAQTEIDFANAVIRGGVTHAGLFLLAMMAQGLLGNDDEWERRKKLEEEGIIGLAWDIRKVENDWRNAEAIYLEDVPLIGDLLAGKFGVAVGEDGGVIAPVAPAWWLKSIISPFIGIARFTRSGNYLDVIDGYADALGSMPLADNLTSSFAGIAQTNALLFQRSVDADNKDLVTDSDIANSYNWMTKIFMNYERIYGEWGFLNTLYTGLDNYQRDPFARVDLNSEGQEQTDKLGQPMESTMQEERLNGAGEMYEGDSGYSGTQGIFRAYGSQRFGVGLFNTAMSVFTGFDKTNMRWNMPVREMKIQKQEITEDADVASIILSVWNEKDGHEILNEQGAAAIARSLHVGLLNADSPALDNIYLSNEQRFAASKILLEELVNQGMEDGLTLEEAKRNASDLFYGDPERDYIEPLYDAIWSKNKFRDTIPTSPTTTYQFLNTTFTMGPDGKLWATGIERAQFSPNFAGIALGNLGLQQYAGAGDLQPINSNLSIDERLNSMDPIGNVNLGMRSMTKVDESQATVRDEDIVKQLDEIIDAILDIPRDGGGGGGYGSGGGGSYARNTYMPYLPQSRSPYWENIPTLYSNTPNIRRVQIRRERFSAERGRLLQWQ